MRLIIAIVSMYAVGSLLPLSTSSREAVWSRRFSRLERRMENTEAASVEAMTAPSRKLSKVGRDRTAQQNSPTSPAVKAVPKEERMAAFPATGLAWLQLVPKPP